MSLCELRCTALETVCCVEITHFAFLAIACKTCATAIYNALPVLQQTDWMSLVIKRLMTPVMCM